MSSIEPNPGPGGGGANLPLDAWMFAEKAARSVSEIQHGINNIADVVVFLEILGYDDKIAADNGFSDLSVLAKYIYPFLDHYENPNDAPNWSYMDDPVPSKRKRVSEAIAIHAPWLGALLILNITGFSLWMATGLPAEVTISFVSGVFLGLFLTEGPLQISSRLFYMYHEQKNVGETRRSVTRGYAVMAAILAISAAGVLAYSAATRIPLPLTAITIAAMVAVSVHRASFNILYTLKKLRAVLAAYASAFAALVAVFYLLPSSLAPDMATRYFTSLGAAFIALSVFAAYYHYVAVVKKLQRPRLRGGSAPAFYSPPTTTENTIRSSFRIQLWESLPFALYGAAYFIMLLGDRVLSWIFSPHVIVSPNGTLLLMAFNAEYHVGADVALFVLIPAAVVQYVLMAPLYSLMHNKTRSATVSEIAKLDSFLKETYHKMIKLVLISSVASGAVMSLFGPMLIGYFNGTEASLQVLRFAALGNISMSVFTANALFMVFLNRPKLAAYLAMAGAAMTMSLGVFFGQGGFQDIVFAYVVSCTAIAAASLVIVNRLMSANPSTNLLARYS
ncbi:MAG: hypothetical protein ABI347_00275 [Nitrososphaera sp.]